MPESQRIVISNTTPIIALSVIQMIIDERLRRRHAQRLGLSVTGVLGVLLRAKQRGAFDQD